MRLGEGAIYLLCVSVCLFLSFFASSTNTAQPEASLNTSENQFGWMYEAIAVSLLLLTHQTIVLQDHSDRFDALGPESSAAWSFVLLCDWWFPQGKVRTPSFCIPWWRDWVAPLQLRQVQFATSSCGTILPCFRPSALYP